MTDKATIEIPSAFKGSVKALNAKEGEVVHVGQVMCTFEGSEAKTAASPAAPAKSPTAPAPAAVSAASSASAPAANAPSMDMNPATRALAAPSTRRTAREMGVDLTHIQGSGPNGRIMKEDLGNG